MLGAVLALNHVYLPHPLIKWQRQLISGLHVSPERLAERLQLLWTSEPAKALQEADALLTETALLAEARTDASISPFREALFQRRRAIDPPHR